MRYVWIMMALVALHVPSLCIAAEGSPAARVTVQVTSGTANGATVEGDEVTLLLYKGREQTDSRSAKAGRDGKAVFENIPVGQGMAAVARAKHQNMAFNSQPVLLGAAAGDVSANVQVYDVSTDTSKLSVGMHHIMIAVRGASLEFKEFMQLNNPSDMAITGAQRDDQNGPVVISIRLPKGFKDLAVSSYLEEEAMVVAADGFHDTLAVPPGEHQVGFSYKLDVGGGAMKIARGITLPTSELMIFWESGQGRLDGLGEPSGRVTNTEGIPVEYYRRDGVKPGEEIAFQISGFHVKHSDSYTWVVLAAVFAAIVLVALTRLRATSAKAGRRNA